MSDCHGSHSSRYAGSHSYWCIKLDDAMECRKRGEHERRKSFDQIHEVMDSIDVSDDVLADYIKQFD